jgi:hypothetical protein
MKIRVIWPAAFLAFATVTSANAQSAYLWEELGTGDGLTVSYNPLTVRRNSGVVTFLEKVSYATPAQLPNGRAVGYYTVDMTINCAANTYSHANFTAYTTDGTVIPNVADTVPAGAHAIEGGAPSAFKTKFCT